MGTTASTAQQTVSASAPFEGLQNGGTMDGRHSLSVHSFQTTGLHNSKAKSIIPNKVAPVVITYNCKEEFQIHDELLKAHYTLGRLSDATPEHYLVQGRYFLVRDVAEKMDVLGTLQSCGAPNFRQVRGGLTVFGMGQPSLSGFRRVLQKLQKDGHRECVIFCVREEPVLFLRADDDFMPYTPRDKQSLHENLQGLGPGVQVERLELAIRKEIHDFAQLSENKYYVYHNTEDLRGEPHAVAVRGEDDVHVTKEVYKRPLFLRPTYRYHRLPLPEQGAPLEAQFDAFVSVLRVDRAITACAELHDLKEVVLENQRELEGSLPETPAQESGSQRGVRQRALRSLERYFYLVLFNYYLHEQYPLAFALSFSRWLCARPELYRLPVTLSSVGPVAPRDLITTGSLALGSILAYLTDNKRKLQQVVWVNLREEAVLECDGRTHSLRWPGPPMAPSQVENLETQLKAHLSMPPAGTQGPRTHRFQTCLTTQEVFSQHRGACPGLTYHRIPMPDFCAPREEDFDRLLGTLQAALAKDPGTGFVFSCLSGQGRTTTAMVVAVLAFWHIRGFPEVGEEELVSVPDAKFTKGEFEVAAKAGIYEILNQLGFPELESVEDQPFSRLRCRWQEQSHSPEPSAAGDFL
ncbi:hypothetical protein E2I00_001291 [Balaenoptera physalus]|uniref:Paladin n=1 Tax=Balaenoptera physalus TaxID=9770 RepID=A0A643CDP0_BALPH|nr:hypothetical protein E2I00_001291 [Balaenoptera physalus]